MSNTSSKVKLVEFLLKFEHTYLILLIVSLYGKYLNIFESKSSGDSPYDRLRGMKGILNNEWFNIQGVYFIYFEMYILRIYFLKSTQL